MNHCYILIGPSGSGKTSLASAIFQAKQKVISHTTRMPRPGEVQGVDYFFISTIEFEKLIQQDRLAEYDFYDGNYYGVSKDELETKLKTGDCYDVLTLQGYLSLAKIYGTSTIIPVLISVKRETVLKRLELREEAPAIRARRMALFDQEQAGYAVLSGLQNLIQIDGDQPLDKMVAQFYRHKARLIKD